MGKASSGTVLILMVVLIVPIAGFMLYFLFYSRKLRYCGGCGVCRCVPLEVAQYAEFLQPESGGIGVYQTFTHVDVRTNCSRWDSRSRTEIVVSGWPGYTEPTEADLAVEWITGAGIMKGNTDGDLMLDDPLTRRQFAVTLHRFIKIQ